MFKNLVTLVAGGTSNLGRATVNRLAKKGSQVILFDGKQSNGEQIATEIGENVHFIPVDVNADESVNKAMNDVRKKFGKLDVLVNCFGVGNKITGNQTDDLEKFQHIVESCLFPTFNMARLSAGLIGDNSPDQNGLRGLIVNTASLEGIQSVNDHPAVAAAYGAIIGMLKPISSDLCQQGIRVVTIVPGFEDTSSPEMKALLSNDYVLTTKQFREPDEFAHVVQTIISNPYINSTTIDLSGGVSQIL